MLKNAPQVACEQKRVFRPKALGARGALMERQGMLGEARFAGERGVWF